MGRAVNVKTVSLSWFAGRAFALTGVDTTTISKERYDDSYGDCRVINFTLNGVTYSAIEDPRDGYRSSLDEIRVVNDVKIINTFPPCKVIANYTQSNKADRKEMEDDVVRFVDVLTGQTVLEIGTSNVDDWYPCFVSHFNPEAMAINATTSIYAETHRKAVTSRPADWGSF